VGDAVLSLSSECTAAHLTLLRDMIKSRVILGDCIEKMRALEPNSIDAVVCDPPYGLEFMGKEWDKLVAPSRGKTANSTEHQPTIETLNDSPHHRAGIKQPAFLKRCQTCGGSSSGNWNRCKCKIPAFRSRNDLAYAQQMFHEAWANEVFRVLKPGGHLLAFGGTRTSHRMVCGIEDAGFEIRDSIHWIYGSGFPKSLNVGKAIDKAAGAEREVIGQRIHPTLVNPSIVKSRAFHAETLDSNENAESWPITAPATDDAKQWQGWGTALKPAHEPIVVARKPLIGTVVQNVLEYGTGAMNIDASRVGYEAGGNLASNPSLRTHINGGNGGNIFPAEDERRVVTPNQMGRWPANLIFSHLEGCVIKGERIDPGVMINTFDDGMKPFGEGAGHPYTSVIGEAQTVPVYQCEPGCPVAEIDKQSGISKSSDPRRADGSVNEGIGTYWRRHGPEQRNCIYSESKPGGQPEPVFYKDTGGASRFFQTFEPDLSVPFKYTAKPSGKERNAGVIGKSMHPTVKPLALMKYLVRLVTPPGGVVLDPFLGSGTTAVACVSLRLPFIGIDNNAEYIVLAKQRIRHAIASLT
jgi:DNA modification methylase